MKASVTATTKHLGHASKQLLSHNVEGYENTFPSLLSDRLRNAKFSTPQNPQTGIALDWEPIGNNMTALSCSLVPGMYLSGSESQLIHNYGEEGPAGILQSGVPVHRNEDLEVEIWARVQHHPVSVHVELQLPGAASPETATGVLEFTDGHWVSQRCVVSSPGEGLAYFRIQIPANCRIFIDQAHLRPVNEGHISAATFKAVKSVPCPVLRFPGGSISCAYHWENGVGPVHLRPVCNDPVFKYKLHYDFGTDEYLELCEVSGIRPFITVNTTTATPEQASAWASYIRQWYVSKEIDVPESYFMIGNENHGVWEIGHVTGEMYVHQLEVFVPLIRDAYPESRIIAIGDFESGGLRRSEETPWRETVISEAADLFDVLAVTRYSVCRGDGPVGAAISQVADSVMAKRLDVERQVQSVRDAGIDKTIAVVEWNYWTRASHNDHAGFYEPNDIRHCLYAAGYLNTFCLNGQMVEMANHYSLFNTMGLIHLHAGRFEVSDVAKVMNLYDAALPGEVMETSVRAPRLTETSPAIDAMVIETAECMYTFLINFSPIEQATVSLNGIGSISGAISLHASDLLQPLNELIPEILDIEITVPPLSVTRVTSHENS